MKQIFIIILIIFTIPVISACDKNSDKQALNNSALETKNNISFKETTLNPNMKPFEEGLKTLTSPQYELVYKLIADGGVNTSLNETVTINIPNSNEEITIEKGATPIGIAALFCNSTLLINLIQNGANPKVKINGVDPAAYIVKCDTSQMLNMIEPFLKAAHSEEKQNKEYRNKKELYSSNAVMNANGFGPTILNYLIQNGNLEAVKTVIKYAGSINFTNTLDPNNNIYPLLNALIYKQYDIFNFLIEKNGNLITNQPLYSSAKASILDLLFYTYPDFALKVKPDTKNFITSILKSNKKNTENIKKIHTYINESNIEDKYLDIYTIAAANGYNNIIKGLFLSALHSDEMYNNINSAFYEAVKNEQIKTVKTLLETGLISQPAIYNAAIYLIKNNTMEKFSENKKAYKILSMISTFTYISPNGFDKKTAKMLKKKKALIKYDKFQALNKGDISDKIIYRLALAGINNKLPFPIKFIKTTDLNGINTYKVSFSNTKLDNEIVIPKGATPLIISVILEKHDAVKTLLLMNADTNIKVTTSNGSKYTALDYANIYSFNTAKILKNKKNFKKENEDKSIIFKDLTLEKNLFNK